jgi:hypothetical protein
MLIIPCQTKLSVYCISSFIMTSKKAPKKPGFAIFKSNNPTMKGDSPPIVVYYPGYNLPDDELSDDNTKKKKFANIIQCIIYLCNFPSDLLMVEYISNKAWSTLRDLTTIMVDEYGSVCINKKDRSFKAKPMNLHLRKLQ